MQCYTKLVLMSDLHLHFASNVLVGVTAAVAEVQRLSYAGSPQRP